jgi:hypothetical protein
MQNFITKIATLILILSVLNSNAQTTTNNQPCATIAPDQQWENELNRLITELVQSQSANQQQAQVFTIPVIMHVVHSGQAVGTYPNLAQGQLVSQVRVLNDDFGGIGYNNWTYPTSAYASWATTQSLTAGNLDALGRVKIANCNVQFCLATKDTLGNILPEPGIDRINRTTKGWTSDPGSFTSITTFRNYMDGTIKPQSIWNVSKYLNIWVTDVNINSTGLLGYATFPPITGLGGLTQGLGTATSDGFWCYAKAFGSNIYFPSGTFYNANTKGRTASHEIGHWVGLRHIWGDASCATDYCNDTPPATASNFGTPNYPLKVGQCAANAPNGEMFMNIMDYSDDISKYMFTPDQATRVLAAMTNSPYRKFLGTHNLCSVAPIATTASFNIAPSACSGAVVTLSNSTNGTPVPSYTWSVNGPGTANFNPNINSALAVSFTAAGVYTITLTSNNGTTSTISKIISVGTSPNLILSIPSQTVCYDDMIHLTGSGANFYAWQPGAQTGTTVSYQAIASQVYTCVGTGLANCKSTATIDISVVDCTGLPSGSKEQSIFKIYPNPTNGVLVVKLYSSGSRAMNIEVIDALGKQVLNQTAIFEKDNETQLTISALPKGIYSIKLSSEDGLQQTLRFVKN